MLDKIFSNAIGATLNIQNVLIILVAAMILGFVISLGYMLARRKTGHSPEFMVTLVMLPAIISILIMLISNNVAYALSLGGAFTLIRFRTTLRETKDLAFLFFAVTAGLACGMGFIGYAAVFAIVLCLIAILLDVVNYGSTRRNELTLKISVPENINYQGIFDDVLNRYSKSWYMKRAKTVDFGALFEVTYRLEVDGQIDQKAMMDEIRTINGNLPVQITLHEYELSTTDY